MEGSGTDTMAELERLRRANADLEMRVRELSVDVADLKDICEAKGITVGEALAVRRHRRMSRRAHALIVTFQLRRYRKDAKFGC